MSMGSAAKRGEIIRYLEEALGLADEIEDGNTYLIERARRSTRKTVSATFLLSPASS
jgi:hypothetical protein